jgi:16S rRNA U1498 N3-methylase RsmE
VVKRIRVGEQVALTDGAGTTVTATVTATGKTDLSATVDEVRTLEPEMPRVVVETPTRLDDRQEELLRELAALRDEESPDGHVHEAPKSVFSRFREAFGPR